jgi:hypothetical protein
MSTLIAPTCGALVGLGALLVVLGLSPTDHRAPRASRPCRPLPPDRLALRAGLAALAGAVIGVGTGWPVAALIAAAGAGAAPSLVGARARRRASIDRLEAIAGWVGQLRDVMAAAAGIQEAVGATAPVAPVAIRSEVTRLAARLEREPLRDAMRAFADEIAHPLADTVVAALVLAAERQGRLADVLTEVARSARQTATMRLRIEAIRARTYVTARLIVFITVGMGAGLVVLRREYLAPFDTFAGQLVVALIGGVFLSAGVMLARLARPTEPPRLLARADQPRW